MQDAEICEKSSEVWRLRHPKRKNSAIFHVLEYQMNLNPEYKFYDSKLAVKPSDLQSLYRFTRWGRSRSLEQIAKMLDGTSMCFSIRHEERLIAFCRILTDFVFRASLWDILVHPDYQGKGIGSLLLTYALEHPAIKDVPVIVTYTSELINFMGRLSFKPRDGLLILQRRPMEYS